MACSKLQRIDLILIGKTGNFKSSSGNTILGRKYFKCSGNSKSETQSVVQEVVEFEGRVVNVTDTPGFEDTTCNEEEGLRHVTAQIENVLRFRPEGFHVCLIVLKYGNRFTVEEKRTIIHIKEIFGETFLRKYCLILMTGGDNFIADHEEVSLTISQWAEQKTGEFKDLFLECNRKIILFDNRKKGKEREDQVRELLHLVNMSGGRRYTDRHFEKAKKAREKMFLLAKFPEIHGETMNEISLVLQEFNKMIQSGSEHNRTHQLVELKARADQLLTKTQALDKETGVLKSLNDSIMSVVANISEEINVRQRTEIEIERMGKKDVSNELVTFLLLSELEKVRLVELSQRYYNDLRASHERNLNNSSCIMM